MLCNTFYDSSQNVNHYTLPFVKSDNVGDFAAFSTLYLGDGFVLPETGIGVRLVAIKFLRFIFINFR